MADSFDQQSSTKGETQLFRMPSADATIPDIMGKTTSKFPTLTIVKGPQTGAEFSLDSAQISLGRDPSNSVFLNDMTVSRHHARMELDEGTGIATIEDLGSLNGTWVDGSIVSKAILHEGSTIQIGTFRLVFHTRKPRTRIEAGA